MKDAKCDSCSRKTPLSLLFPKNQQMLCTVCYARSAPRTTGARGRPVRSVVRSGASGAAKRPKSHTAPDRVSNSAAERMARCERCMMLAPIATMTNHNDEHLCVECVPSRFVWLAAAIVGSDSKVRETIKKRIANTPLASKLGRVVIPKIREARLTKDRYRAVDREGKPIMIRDWRNGKLTEATLSANDPEDALFQAKRMWDCSEVEQSEEEKKRKTIKGKRQTVKQIKFTGTIKVYVDDVEKIKDGGTLVTQNKRAMPGYILIECERDMTLERELRQVKGIYSLLPYTEPFDYEDTQDDEFELPKGTSLSKAEVKRWAEPQKDQPVSMPKLTAGDKVKVIAGAFRDQYATVIRIDVSKPDDPKIICACTMMGRSVDVSLNVSQIAK